jgi:hypothetical protein
MSALAAVSLLEKMVQQFGELGWDSSILHAVMEA